MIPSGLLSTDSQRQLILFVQTEYRAKKYAEIYIDRIVCLHGVSKTIISDRGTQFVARFWEQLQEALGTKLI